jgi:hypothetical protein
VQGIIGGNKTEGTLAGGTIRDGLHIRADYANSGIPRVAFSDTTVLLLHVNDVYLVPL